jgi:putative endopeptidase
MREYLAVTDVHAPDKLRCNRVLQTLPEFYTTYGIQPGDGMWTAPETRVSVW